jgi:hypothetical protein
LKIRVPELGLSYDGIVLQTGATLWYMENQLLRKEETTMKLRIAVSITLLAGFALLLACQTAPQQTVAPGGGKVRIVKLTVPDCG